MIEILVLRLIHVVGGIFWVGSGLFTMFFLMPALVGAGPPAGAVMAGMQRRRLFVVLPVVALLTILSGIRLMWITSGGFASAYFATGIGATFAVGAAAGVLAFLLGIVVSRPAGARMAALGAQIAAATDEAARARLEAERSAAQGRAAAAGVAVAGLLIVAAAAMAVARYMG